MAERFVGVSLLISLALHSSPIRQEKFQHDMWGWSFNSDRFHISWFEKEAWFTIAYCYILALLNLHYNTLRLFGITLRLLMPISWKASSGSLKCYASLAFFLTFLPIMLVHLSFHSCILYNLEGFTLVLFFQSRFFQDLNYVLLWLIALEFLLVVSELSPNFL